MFHSRHSERDDDERRVRATLLPTSNRSNGYDRNSAGFDDLFDQRSRQAQVGKISTASNDVAICLFMRLQTQLYEAKNMFLNINVPR